MGKGIVKLLSILLACLLPLALAGESRAYEPPEDFSEVPLEQAMEEFRKIHGLNENNFSVSYYNTVTGESYAWNDTWFSIAASTYKLPLNMYFYEMQLSGEITGDTKISWTGQTLDYIHEQSIVNSNNELSEALMYYWGDHVTYKENLRKYFTMTDEEIAPSYWQANWFCTRMMMDCLKYLYENQENFEELIGYMKQAMPDQYFKRGVTEYEVAHKYGSVQVYNNDVGIIYTPQPILLAVYSQGGNTGGDGVCADAARLMTAYTLWQEQQNPVEAPEETPAEPSRGQELQVEQLPAEPAVPEELPAEPSAEEEVLPVPAEPAENKQPDQSLLLAAVVVGLVLLLALLRSIRKRK
ncbi:MAG: serine hydrolase [Clostridia bacterium]|nr:serine hydrolase [Clostridia bacterium]